jgi:hypothetical protein
MKAADELTKANFLERFFTDIPGAAEMTPRQMLDAFFERLNGPVMTDILKGHFEHVPNVTIMVQNAGATLEEAARAAMEGRRLPLAPYVTDVAGMLKELDGTAKGETGAITVTYSEPQGFPFHFHWTATITIDGTTTTTPIMVERQ